MAPRRRDGAVGIARMDAGILWFLGWSVLLAALLFVPVTRLIWTFSVRRQERKLERKLDEAELEGQLRRARFLTVFVVAVFALLFNYHVFGIPGQK